MEIIKAIRLLTFFSAITVTALLSGCTGFVPMNSGVLATPGCTITAEDNSFTIVSGQEFQPPFQINGGFFEGLPGGFQTFCDFDPQERVKAWGKALECGAKPVRVTVPGRAEPLHGVLALFEITSLGTGPGTSSYRIEIPQQYVDAATGGRISVVYESYPDTYNVYHFPSWVLWLSDQPIQ